MTDSESKYGWFYRQFNEIFSCSYDIQIAKKFVKNVLYVIEIDNDLLINSLLNYTTFSFIEKYSFFENEKEILFLNKAVFGIDKIRYVKEDLNKSTNKNSNDLNNSNLSYYEITMHFVSIGINKYDHLKFSDSDFLNLSSKNFPDYDISTINDIIKFNSNSKVIYLQNNAIGLSSSISGNNNSHIPNLSSFTQNLIMNPSLIGINVSQNNFGFNGTKLICEVISHNNRISWLNISSNQICDEGACYIAITLEKNNSLKWLEINDNKISFLGIEKISEALIVNRCLKKLDIGNNNISDTGIVKISTMLKINNTLDWLDLSSNKITITGIKVFFQALSENIVLKYVNLWDNLATYKEINRIDKLNLINKEIEY